jgi:hypothetical protein
MASIDELFAAPRKYDHPRLRSWRSYKNSPDTTRCHVEYRRKRWGLSGGHPLMYFEVERKDGTVFVDREPWEDDFNAALVEAGFRAIDEENEGKRFGYALWERMRRLGFRFGDFFFHSVVVNYLKRNEYHQDPLIALKLAAIEEYAPQHGDVANDCEERIDHLLSRCVEELAGLGYEPATGKGILNAAIANYLDDNFRITGRAAVGWK